MQPHRAGLPEIAAAGAPYVVALVPITKSSAATFRCEIDHQPCEVALRVPSARPADLREAWNHNLLPCVHCKRGEQQIETLARTRFGHVARHVLTNAPPSMYAPIDPLTNTRAGREALLRAIRSLAQAGIVQTLRGPVFMRQNHVTCVRLTPFGAALVRLLHCEFADGERIRWSEVLPVLRRALRRRGERLARLFARNVRADLCMRFGRSARSDVVERLRAATSSSRKGAKANGQYDATRSR